MSGSNPEYRTLVQLATDIRLLRAQCAELTDSEASNLLMQLVEHMTSNLQQLMDRPGALRGTMPWWQAKLEQQQHTVVGSALISLLPTRLAPLLHFRYGGGTRRKWYGIVIQQPRH
jgi:hypothetical protein